MTISLFCCTYLTIVFRVPLVSTLLTASLGRCSLTARNTRVTPLRQLSTQLLRTGRNPLLGTSPVRTTLHSPTGTLLPLELPRAALEVRPEPTHLPVDTTIPRLRAARADGDAVLLPRAVVLRAGLAVQRLPELGRAVDAARRRRAGEVEGVGVVRLAGDLGLGVGGEGALARCGAGWVGLGGELWGGVVTDLDSWLVLIGKC